MMVITLFQFIKYHYANLISLMIYLSVYRSIDYPPFDVLMNGCFKTRSHQIKTKISLFNI